MNEKTVWGTDGWLGVCIDRWTNIGWWIEKWNGVQMDKWMEGHIG